MRWFLELTFLSAAFFAAFFLAPSSGQARPDYSRRTQKECNFCHPPDSWNLTDAGKYYRDHHHSLQGYNPPKTDSKQGKS